MNRLRNILLTILIAVASGAAGQGYVIDSVCRGAERHYRIDGETGSYYFWTITDSSGTVKALPETADTVTITWNTPAGEYVLATLQTNKNGCDSLQLGTIRVFDLPLAFAGAGITLCTSNPYTLANATASGYSRLVWQSTGDGIFSDTNTLHPVYTFGTADILLGSVKLTLKAAGFGREGSCPPTISSISISLYNGIIPILSAIGPFCMNSTPPALPPISANSLTGTWEPASINTSLLGTASYTFTTDSGECAKTATLEVIINPLITPVFTKIGPLCVNSPAPILPQISMNGIIGTWAPDSIGTSITATTTYTFTPDSGQCALPTTLVIEVGSPEITEIQTTTSTNNLPNGFAVIIATGTEAPFTYSLNGTTWQVSNTFHNLVAGTYMAWVKDSKGCIKSQQFIIMNTITGEVGVLAGNVLSCISVPVGIPVLAYDFTNISAFTIQLAFDSSLLSFTGLSQVNTLLDAGNLTISLISPGSLQIRFNATDSITMLSEDLLFKLNFYGLASGQTKLQWDLLISVIYSAIGYEIPTIYTQGAVEITPVPQIFTDGSGEYCEGIPLKLNAGSLTNQNLTYLWTSPNGLIHNGQQLDLGNLSLNASGEYQVTAADNTTCARTETLQVQVYPNPDIKLADYDTLCAEEHITLNPGLGFSSYVWQDGSTQPQFEPNDQGIYWVTVTDLHGCKDSDTVTLSPCELLIWIPNVFSPNGDGLNDQFIAKYNRRVSIAFKMLVFNKWGEELFSSYDITKGWDGTYKGMPCPPDLYTWTVSFNAPVTYNFVQKSPLQGTVMLLR